MIDMHSHILPRMDDGSDSRTTSWEILAKMKAQGVTTVAATSHYDMREESVEDFVARRQKALLSLREEEREMPRIVTGAEVLYCGVSMSQMEDIEKLCINGSRYILIEPMDFKWEDSFVLHMQQLMVERGLTPILAHWERYRPFRKNRGMVEHLQQEGMLVQTNTEGFLHKRTKRKALYQLAKGEYQIIGTDCHNLTTRPPNLLKAAEVIRTAEPELWKRLMNQAEEILAD